MYWIKSGVDLEYDNAGITFRFYSVEIIDIWSRLCSCVESLCCTSLCLYCSWPSFRGEPMDERIHHRLIDCKFLNFLLSLIKWNHLLNELFGCRGLALVLPFCWLVKEKAHIFLSSVKISSSYIFCHPLYSMQGQSFLHPFEYVTCLVPRVLPTKVT